MVGDLLSILNPPNATNYSEMIFMWLLSVTICAVSKFSVVLSECSVDDACKNMNNYPVILIPGNGGSQLNAKLNKTSVVRINCVKKTNDYENIWLNLLSLTPITEECLVDNLRLIYDHGTHKTKNSPGVNIRIPGWGNCSEVENIDPTGNSIGSYFKTISETLVKAGLERNISIRGAPYDFRKAANEHEHFFCKLKRLIEQTYQDNDKTPVVILTHSMGGCMALQFLQDQIQEWKDEYIKSLISLAAPWGGSVKTLKVFATGDNLGHPILLDYKVLQEYFISCPSTAWLLPSQYFWSSDEILIESATKNITTRNYETFFENINYMAGYQMFLDTKPYTDNGAPGVEIHCLYGSEVQTVEKLKYSNGNFKDEQPELIYGNGDGTVNYRSLKGCAQWSTMQEQKVFCEEFSEVNHDDIMTDEGVLDYIIQVVTK